MSDSQYKKQTKIKIIASHKNWIESEAIQQLENTANLDGIEQAIGLPDLHPGKGHPIGAVFVSHGWIYPALVGNDIGCGMGLWKTSLTVQKINLDKWTKNLSDLDCAWNGDTTSWLTERNIQPTEFDVSLGTIGRGNHFAELQQIETVNDTESFEALELDKKSLYLLVHSGSRGLGESIANAYGLSSHLGLPEHDHKAQQYIQKHNEAVRWAKANRELIAHRFLTCLHAKSTLVLDIHHNTVTKKEIGNKTFWLHRNGATPSTEGAVIIPGSRGDYSYLVMPIGLQEYNAYSLAHGAGRKWKRNDAKGKLAKYRIADFTKTSLGSRVICEDKALIYEEAPQAYKNINRVIDDLVDAGLIKVIATLRPLITYKTRRDSDR